METLIDRYTKMLISCIDSEGIFPAPAFFQNKDDTLEVVMFAVETHQLLLSSKKRCREERKQQVLIGLDTWCKPDQGTTLDSCIIVFHVKNGQCCLGVLEYSWNDGEPITKPINWNNVFWLEAYAKLMLDMATW